MLLEQGDSSYLPYREKDQRERERERARTRFIYSISIVAPTLSSFSLSFSASSLETPSFIVFGALSTNSLASLRPSSVMARTSLITCRCALKNGRVCSMLHNPSRSLLLSFFLFKEEEEEEYLSTIQQQHGSRTVCKWSGVSFLTFILSGGLNLASFTSNDVFSSLGSSEAASPSPAAAAPVGISWRIHTDCRSKRDKDRQDDDDDDNSAYCLRASRGHHNTSCRPYLALRHPPQASSAFPSACQLFQACLSIDDSSLSLLALSAEDGLSSHFHRKKTSQASN